MNVNQRRQRRNSQFIGVVENQNLALIYGVYERSTIIGLGLDILVGNLMNLPILRAKKRLN